MNKINWLTIFFSLMPYLGCQFLSGICQDRAKIVKSGGQNSSVSCSPERTTGDNGGPGHRFRDPRDKSQILSGEIAKILPFAKPGADRVIEDLRKAALK